MKKQTLSKNEIAAFCEQMAMILATGITPKDGLELMVNDARDAATHNMLERLMSFTLSGDSFSSAVKQSGYFPEYVENMIVIGEETGNLDEIMQSLSKYYTHEEMVSENVRNAITYPLVMICMMLFIIVVLITKVLPLFDRVFIQLGTEMTGIAASLLKIGQNMQTYSVILIALLVIVVLLIFFLGRVPAGKKLMGSLKESFGPTRRFYEGIAYGRFANGLALTLSSGIGIHQALKMVSDLVEHAGVKEQIKICDNSIEEGNDLASALKEAGLFGNLYSRMIAIGVKTGNVDVILAKIATLYEEDTDKKLNNYISVIEPTLVIVLSLIVGLILLSVILPLLGVMTSIG